MTALGYKVDPGELGNHAKSLEDVAKQVGKAAEKGAGVSFGMDTFGIIGQIFAGESERLATEAVGSMNEFAEGVQGAADGVRSAGEYYAGMDTDAAGGFDSLGKAVG